MGFELIARGDIKPEVDMETEDIPDNSSVGTQPLSKFEAIPDDISPEEILLQCQVKIWLILNIWYLYYKHFNLKYVFLQIRPR